MSSINTASDELIRLRVAGIGHDVQFSIPSSATIGDVKTKVVQAVLASNSTTAAADTNTSSSLLLTLLPPQYILLLCRGKKLLDDTATLTELHIQDRTRLMLLHSPLYARDKVGIESIQTIMKELVEGKKKLLLNDNNDNNKSTQQQQLTLDEMVTRACIKLDEIDVSSGSDTLRAMRKDALKRAEDVAATAAAAADKEGEADAGDDDDDDDAGD